MNSFVYLSFAILFFVSCSTRGNETQLHVESGNKFDRKGRLTFQIERSEDQNSLIRVSMMKKESYLSQGRIFKEEFSITDRLPEKKWILDLPEGDYVGSIQIESKNSYAPFRSRTYSTTVLYFDEIKTSQFKSTESEFLPIDAHLKTKHPGYKEYVGHNDLATYYEYSSLEIRSESERIFFVRERPEKKLNLKKTGLVWAWFGLAFTNPAFYPGIYAVVYGSFFLGPVIFGSAIYNYKTEVEERTQPE
ncbi:hypothetical protein JWG44_13755 [Leptospira sp. 201903071]|uniref:hypothetical protein n=1 Tax=Leptospira ainazelensis TaxID=2810034 RepID=UPI001963792C|nr:hypothetical protein [Leptospira ainazelensis]MBM9501317.1 hypothetical protein [Leptospira ainazelensis]